MSVDTHGNDPPVSRRLTAIVFADVAGFSRLMGEDDVATLARWKALRRDVVAPRLSAFRGRLLRVVGDALLIEFHSAVDAVNWACEVQQALAGASNEPEPPLRLRIGINVEDAIVDEGDLHGDGVNVSARIQALAEPGEILVTAAVHDYVRNKVEAGFTDLGEPRLKNIDHPVRVYRVEPGRRTRAAPAVALTWSKLPSIAVLPFRNLGGPPQEEYFGEGITEDIIGALARNRSLFVIARHSTLAYRDQRADARQIAAELGVRYIVAGSVRRQTARLRIAADLIDAEQNRTIWAEHYDGANDDIFEFQDRIAASIVATIEPRVYEAEAARVRHKPTDSLDAYDCLLRALSLLYTFDDGDFAEAGRVLDRAVGIDPSFAQAHAYKAWWLILRIGEGRSADLARDADAAESASQRAVALDANDAFVLAVAAHVQAFLRKRTDVALDLFDRALHINPNSAFAWGLSASTCCFLGRADDALERLGNAWRLSPFDPLNFWYWTVAGIAHFVAGRYEEAVPWLRKARGENARFCPCHRTLTASLALLGRMDEAREAARDLLSVEPSFRVSAFASWYPLRDDEDLSRLVAGLLGAGLPG
jgi:TolB-like protein/Flp pilus assembly protein TadD